jgi:hypothetical protein
LHELSFDVISRIFTNPANNELFIELKKGFEKGVYFITDASGKIVLQNQWSGCNLVKVNTSNLAKGIYFVNLQSNDERISSKIILE